MTEQKNNLDNQERIVVQENAYTPEDIDRKRILSLILAFLLILTLGGCAMTQNSDGEENASPSKKSDNSNSLPDYFPKDLGLIPDSILKGESDSVASEGDGQNSDTAFAFDKWPTHGAAANIPELGKYSELKVTDMNILGSDEFIIECKTSKEDFRQYAESVIEKFPLKRTKIDEDGLYSVTGHDNEGLVFTAQHDSSTDVAIIQIYVDSFFDPENPDGRDENDVPNWINKP